MVGLSAEMYVCRRMTQQTGGTYTGTARVASLPAGRLNAKRQPCMQGLTGILLHPATAPRYCTPAAQMTVHAMLRAVALVYAVPAVPAANEVPTIVCLPQLP